MRALLALYRRLEAGPYARPFLVALLLLGPSLIIGTAMFFASYPAAVALLGIRPARLRIRVPARRTP